MRSGVATDNVTVDPVLKAPGAFPGRTNPSPRQHCATVASGKQVERALAGIAAPVLSVQLQLVSDWRTRPQITLISGHKRLPLDQRGRAAKLVGLSIDEVAFLVEVIMKRGVDRGELL